MFLRICIFFPLVGILLSACDQVPRHESWACSAQDRIGQLSCEMSKKVPLFRDVDDMVVLDICGSDSQFFAFSSIEAFEETQQTQKYIAIGGYCDYAEKYSEVLDLAEQSDKNFDGLYLQVFSCDPQQYETENLRAEAIGIEIDSFRLKGCEPLKTK